jgi:hypothetical protein
VPPEMTTTFGDVGAGSVLEPRSIGRRRNWGFGITRLLLSTYPRESRMVLNGGDEDDDDGEQGTSLTHDSSGRVPGSSGHRHAAPQ